jgi:predicted P-loop ATPase
VLVLEGGQGLRKSGLFQALADEWFADTAIDVTNKDSRMLAACSWVIELAELAAVKRGENEAHKAFFSQSVDRFRPPYAAAIEAFPRCCVFVATTNPRTYLTDETGNRRYLPVHCMDEVPVRLVREDRDLIWAEAVELYLAAGTCAVCRAAPDGEDRCDEHRWWFTLAEQQQMAHITKARMKRNGMADCLRAWWLRQKPERVRVHELVEDVLKQPQRIADSDYCERVCTALEGMGFVKIEAEDGGTMTYEATKALMEKPKAFNRLRLIQKIAEAKPQPEAT